MKKIYLSSPHMSEEGYEKEYIKNAFDTNWIAPLGPNVDNFEKEVCELTGAKNAVALNSGTSAIHLALKACGVGKDDIVICQSLTFSATANPIIYQNAIPVFVDSDYKTWNIDPNSLEKALIKYPEAKAVIIVHLYGICAEIEKIVDLCKKYNTTLIEDAAESLGTLYKGNYTGTFGDYGIYSFNGNKIITTSGGGMVISSNKEKIQRIRFWSTQARDKARHYQHSELGFNYRMSNIVAGIGRGQLKVLKDRINKKRYIFEYYHKAFEGIKDISFMPQNDWERSNCWLSVILIEGKVKPLDVILALEKENIESRPIWKPMHMQPFFSSYDYIGSGISENLFKKGVCLPSDTKLTDRDLLKISNIVKRLFNE
ncbi:DegT/DnrJ/EryC1/StrS family aminotransferase [Candidatus Izemoplasma sp. B36]|uniref:DegT/DnrJ/EryC1/StrS family aminotransferase n=1 Tax=Candidatus Izemoplasma sp. B36 TaxID=3242468 RepID=UPI0035563228